MADFQRLPDRAMVALRHKDGTAHRLPTVGQSQIRGGDRIVAIGPDEWLIVAADDDDGLTNPSYSPQRVHLPLQREL